MVGDGEEREKSWVIVGDGEERERESVWTTQGEREVVGGLGDGE
ncbi:hypothetical protein TIFTF001_026717 [Ficus carica]|uniref:Uncharacterized protein n=1 Tax=Ficus carica TaxID=3494 RepID=A0AA88DLM0_FICCA|nr:hypothetical protein TIFTF001_026717 [Ficus carica]